MGWLLASRRVSRIALDVSSRGSVLSAFRVWDLGLGGLVCDGLGVGVWG